jgi:hypothetical protein
MNRNNDITIDNLNRALREMSRKARRQNRALGLTTVYEKDGYLVKLDPLGNEHIIK